MVATNFKYRHFYLIAFQSERVFKSYVSLFYPSFVDSLSSMLWTDYFICTYRPSCGNKHYFCLVHRDIDSSILRYFLRFPFFLEPGQHVYAYKMLTPSQYNRLARLIRHLSKSRLIEFKKQSL